MSGKKQRVFIRNESVALSAIESTLKYAIVCCQHFKCMLMELLNWRTHSSLSRSFAQRKHCCEISLLDTLLTFGQSNACDEMHVKVL